MVWLTAKMRIIQLILGFSVRATLGSSRDWAVWRIPLESEAQYAKWANYLSKERNIELFESSPKFYLFINN